LGPKLQTPRRTRPAQANRTHGVEPPRSERCAMRRSARVVVGVVALAAGLLTLEGAALSVGLSHSGQVAGLSTVRALEHATTIVARTSTAVIQRMLVDRFGDGVLGAVC